MKSLILFTLLVITISYNTYGQASVKGFKSIEKGEYDKATEYFLKALKEEIQNSASNLGLAMIYSTEAYNGHDFFKAWDYITKANENFNKLTPEENVFLKDYFGSIDPRRRNRTNRYNYDIEIKNIEDKLIKYVREENNVEIAEHFIKAYPNSKYFENVVHIRNHIEFRTAEKTNTLEAYHNFIKEYPDAAQVPKAIKACSVLAFEEAKNLNTIEAYNNYMKDYPEAEKYFEALKLRDQLAFNNAKNINTIDAVDGFISNYPKAMQVMSARAILRKLIYERAKQVNTLEAYNEFISKYPEGEYFVDIFNLKSNALGEKMAVKFEGNKEAVVWVKGFDYEDNNDIAGGILETADGKIVIAGTREKSGYNGTQSWIIAMDKSGKVLWNKAFGSQRYNHSSQVMLLPEGNLLITGWAGRSADTIFRKSWMCKVSQAGSGIWEKNVEGNEIKDFIRTSEGEYYLSGYQIDDSLSSRTFIEKLNPDYKKLWSRQYNQKGSLNGITLNSKNEVICAEGRWIFRINPQGYLLWEKSCL